MVKMDVDTSSATAFIAELSGQLEGKYMKAAVLGASNAVGKLMAAEAQAQGYGSQGKKSSESGWEWETYGRIPRAIIASKPFRKGMKKGDIGRKVFLSKGKQRTWANKAPHAHLQYSERDVWVPVKSANAKKGFYKKAKNGNGYLKFIRRQGVRLRFSASIARARSVFQTKIEAQIEKAIKKAGSKA